jgi:hypothetical protein
MMPLEGIRCISTLYLNREAREEAKSLLPLSGGPTQAGTTPELMFRAVIGSDAITSVLEVVL